PLFAVGYSLGGNALLKLCAKHQPNLRGSVAISSPINLKASSEAINKGFSRVYQYHLLKSMKHKFISKMQRVNMKDYIRVTAKHINTFETFYDFDEHLTAPIHGFSGADDYYKRASAKPELHKITTNTLILHAADDPFMDEQVIPNKHELSPTVAYELAQKGGHVGFMQRKSGRLTTYIPERIGRFIEELT
ncbi:MAG: alpha/beta fold hydrolase, partial [Pseudomonadota bacterium]